MRYRSVVATALLLALTPGRAVPGDAGQALPVRDGRPVVAVVNGEAISLDQFVLELDAPADRNRLLAGRGAPAELDVLNRLVTVRLIVQESRKMGLADLPVIRKEVDVMSRSILRQLLMEHVVKDVKPDPADVEKRYKELVREWKTTALFFREEGSAVRARKEIAGGAAFSDVAGRAAAAKTANAEDDRAYHSRKDYLPEIAEAIAPLQVGQVSPVIRTQTGFVVVRVVDIRYAESAEARAEARRAAAGLRQQAALVAYEDALRAKYVVVNKKVLSSINYEARQPGIDALLKDKRVVAEIKGANPVTVGDLTDYLRMQFFHGGDPAGQAKRMNARKDVGLDAMVGRRVMNSQALRLGMDKTSAYRDRVSAFRDSLVFDAFVQKVIAPDNKMREEEVKGYYDKHRPEYSSPEMMRIRSLAFTRRSAAETAMRKLREGADYKWLVANAEGQVDKKTEGLLTLDGRPVTTSSMPGGVQKALAGAKAGDYRLYAGPEERFYVLAVQEVIAPTARPVDEVRAEIAKKLYDEKLKKGVEGYAGRLRALSKIAIYLRRTQ